MRYLNNYNGFLLETKSISDSCEVLQEKIINDLENIINKFDKNVVVHNYYDLDEKDFKLKKLKVIFNLIKFNKNICNGITDLKNSKLEDEVLDFVQVKFDIFIENKNDDYFNDFINSVVLHECLHIFQHYNILTNKKFRPSSWSIGVILNQLRGSFSDKINNIIELLYESLLHEIAAQIHQYYYFEKKKKKYIEIYNTINNLENFNIPILNENEMIELNYLKDKIYQSIIFYTTNKNYIKKLNKSMWIEKNNDIFLEGVKNMLSDRAKYIKKKMLKIDKKIKEDFDNLEYKTIPTTFLDKDFEKINNFDPHFFVKLLESKINNFLL